jgi:hypothetical protein
MLKFGVPHSLPREQARQRVEKLVSYWSAKYGLKAAWSGDSATLSGKAMGISLQARLEVRDGGVEGEATDPGFLLRDRARKYLAQKFGDYLDPSTPLTALKG